MSATRRPRTNRRTAGPYAGKGLNALQVARECVGLGACKRTIALMTGLPPTFILRFVFDRDAGARRGRPPYSDEFLARASLRLQAAASAFAARYERLRSSGFPPAESLITAYKHYLTFPNAPMLLFDEAFYLCCNLDGIWAARSKTMQLADCRCCGSRHLQPYGSTATASCAFCNIRRSDDGQQAGQAAGRDDLRSASSLDARLAALKIRRMLKDLGASDRTADALMSGMADIDPSLRPPAPTQLVYCGLPLPLQRWGSYLKTVRRIQYSLVGNHYSALRDAGFGPEESVVATFRHLEGKFRHDKPLTLDRCVEVVSLVDARWGVEQPELDRKRCEACEAHYLISRRDGSRQPCPFCSLRRFPSQYRGAAALPSDAAMRPGKSDFPVDEAA
jgi:flagellar transcriptional activator FlhC